MPADFDMELCRDFTVDRYPLFRSFCDSMSNHVISTEQDLSLIDPDIKSNDELVKGSCNVCRTMASFRD